MKGLHHKGDGEHGVGAGEVQVPHGGFQVAVDVQVAAPQEGIEHGAVETVGVVEGQGAEYPVIKAHVLAGIAQVLHHGLLAEHDHFGLAGGAGGKDDLCRLLLGHGELGLGQVLEGLSQLVQLLDTHHPLVAGQPAHEHRPVGVAVVEQGDADGEKGGGEEEQPGLGADHHIPDVFVRLLGVHTHSHGAAADNGQKGDDPVGAVFADNGHMLSGS